MTKRWLIALCIAGPFGDKAFADCVPSPDTPASVEAPRWQQHTHATIEVTRSSLSANRRVGVRPCMPREQNCLFCPGLHCGLWHLVGNPAWLCGGFPRREALARSQARDCDDAYRHSGGAEGKTVDHCRLDGAG